MMSRFAAALAAIHLVGSTASALDYEKLIKGRDRVQQYQVFRNFKIKGICGTGRVDLARRFGANTMRGYTVSLKEDKTRRTLDKAKSLGMRVILGIWMPRQGKNKDNWNFDYNKSGDRYYQKAVKAFDSLGGHPAALMWSLGNEVPLDPAYLKVVNRICRYMHKKNPRALTTLTIINAPVDKIKAIRKHAPDLDVIGVNSYSPGAIRQAINNMEKHWGRAYYFAEYGAPGPWHMKKTSWGRPYETTVDTKVKDLRQILKSIDNAPRCVGSTVFYWGMWFGQGPTYFSLMLGQDPAKGLPNKAEPLVTPMAGELSRYWSGKYPPKRAPVLTKLQINGKAFKDVVLKTGESFTVTADARDPDSKRLEYRCWIFQLPDKGRMPKKIAGPFKSDTGKIKIKSPDKSGSRYFLLCYVVDHEGGASGCTLPFKVE